MEARNLQTTVRIDRVEGEVMAVNSFDTFIAAVREASYLDAATRRERVDAMRPLVPDEKLLFLMELSIEPILDILIGRSS